MGNDIIKKGAKFLLKGGTLLAEPCKVCGNLQIKYENKIRCLNCEEISDDDKKPEREEIIYDKSEKVQEVNNKKIIEKLTTKSPNIIINDREYTIILQQLSSEINQKVSELTNLIKVYDDYNSYKKNLKTLILLLKVLKNIKRINN